MDFIVFKNAPIPPSDNQLYRNVPRIGRVKTKEYKLYEHSFKSWAWTQHHQFKTFKTWKLEATTPLYLEMNLKLIESRLYTKVGSIKRFDVQNRSKCFIDLLCKQLEIDDSRLFRVALSKSIGPDDSLEAVISLTPIHLVEAFQEN